LTAERARLARTWAALPRTLRAKLEEDAAHGANCFAEPVAKQLADLALLVEHLQGPHSPENLVREREIKARHAAAWVEGALV
jgi:hypothetical protein